jgi:hypothetical protein
MPAHDQQMVRVLPKCSLGTHTMIPPPRLLHHSTRCSTTSELQACPFAFTHLAIDHTSPPHHELWLSNQAH